MAKKIKTFIKLNLKAGEATPAPPVGPALGQHGVPIMEFVKEYNARTADKKGTVIPVIITVFDDRTFTFITKIAPVSELIKKKVGIQKGSAKPNSEKIATITIDQAKEIAKEKMDDLNTEDIEMATRIVLGTAKSMGITVQI